MLIGEDSSADPEINTYATRFLLTGLSGTRFEDFYTKTTRFRKLIRENSDGTFLEVRAIVYKNKAGDLFIKPEGFFVSDGR
jgi:hypothetical protein